MSVCTVCVARADIDTRHRHAARGEKAARNSSSSPLVSAVANDINALHRVPARPARLRCRPPPRRPASIAQGHCIFVRRAYHNDMKVSRQSIEANGDEIERGPRARTRRLMMRDGDTADASWCHAFGQRGRRGRRSFSRNRLSLFPEPGGAGPCRGRRGARPDPDLASSSKADAQARVEGPVRRLRFRASTISRRRSRRR